jgi:hypothetical protein
MQRVSIAPPPVRSVRALATRVGHDAVWLAIAGLFCVVEGAVKLTEIAPTKYLRFRRSSATRAGISFNSRTQHPASGAFAR